VNRLGTGFDRAGDFSVHDSTLLLQGIATIRRIVVDLDHPDTRDDLPAHWDRIEGLISPVVDGTVVAIRTPQKQIFTLCETADSGILSNKADPLNAKRHHDDFLERTECCDHLAILRLAAQYRRNILLVGPTGSGQRTFATALSESLQSRGDSIRSRLIGDWHRAPALCFEPDHEANQH